MVVRFRDRLGHRSEILAVDVQKPGEFVQR